MTDSKLLQLNLFGTQYKKSAVLSEDGKYRYHLSRRWTDTGKTVAFICLNPSTADADNDDPTVKKCVRLAKRWGAAQMIIGNLFAYRSTDPRNLYSCTEPIGSENDQWLSKIADEADILVAAWGTNGTLLERDKKIREEFTGKLQALRLTKDGHPSHPLYLPEHLTPFQL